METRAVNKCVWCLLTLGILGLYSATDRTANAKVYSLTSDYLQNNTLHSMALFELHHPLELGVLRPTSGYFPR